jgi:hypothetical protein
MRRIILITFLGLCLLHGTPAPARPQAAGKAATSPRAKGEAAPKAPAPAADAAASATSELRPRDQGDPARNRELLERAIELANKSLPIVRPIVIPAVAGGFAVDRPIIAFGKDLEIRGANPGTIFKANGVFPPLVLGLQDWEWSKDHIVDAKGRIDTSLAPASGAWSGISTGPAKGDPDTVFSFMNSGFDRPFGKSYSELRSFTFELAYEPSPSTPAGYPICGLSETGFAYPWFLQTANWLPVPSYCVVFKTTDGVTRNFTWPILDGGDPGTGKGGSLRRLSFSIDLDTLSVAASSGGKQLKVAPNKALERGLSFADSGLTTFKLGGLGLDPAVWKDNFGGPQRLTFYGCRMSEGTYAPPAKDAAMYGPIPPTGRMIARLMGEAVPRDGSRAIPWALSVGMGYGLALAADKHTHPLNTGTKVRLSDLTLLGGSPDHPFGAGIWCGGSIDGGFRFERCTFRGGQDGFRGLMAGACYPVLFRDCTFRGYAGNGFVSRMMSATFEGLTTVEYPARNGMVFVAGNADIAHLFMSEAGKGCETYVSMIRGGRLTLRNGMFDTEYNAAPTLACILAERNVWGDFPGTRLSVADSVIDGGAKGVPLLLLRDMSKEKGFPATFEFRGIQSWHAERGPTVQTDGPMWSGKIEGFLGNRGAWREHVSTWGDASAIDGVK